MLPVFLLSFTQVPENQTALVIPVLTLIGGWRGGEGRGMVTSGVNLKGDDTLCQAHSTQTPSAVTQQSHAQ